MRPTKMKERLLVAYRKWSPRGRLQNGKRPRLLAYRSSTTFILIAVCLAIFTDIFLYGLVVPVIPFALTERVGVTEDHVQKWNAILLASYSGATTVGAPFAGWFADRISSRRGPLLFGLVTLAGSTLLLCLARTIGLLVLGRLLQGLSAAIVWSVGLALLADTVGKDGIGFAMGWVGIAMSAGLLASPVIGGAVYGQAGYYAVFYVAFGLIFLDIVLRLVLIEKKVARQWAAEEQEQERDVAQPDTGKVPMSLRAPPDLSIGQDYPTEKEITVETGPSRVPTAQAGEATSASPGCEEDEAPAPERSSCEGIMTSQERRHPILTLFRSRRLMAGLLCVLVQAGAWFLPDTVLPLFLKETFDWDATSAGLMFLCILIPGLLNPLIGALVDRKGARWPAFGGFLASVPLLVCLRFVTHNTLQDKILLGALLALLGTALAFTNVPLMAEITLAIEADEERNPGIWGEKSVYGIGYGLFSTAFSLGGTVGSLMSGYLQAERGWPTVTWVFGVWMSAGVVVTALWVGRPQKGVIAQSGPGGVDIEAESAGGR